MPRFLGLSNGEDGVINLSSYTQIKASCSGSEESSSLSATHASFEAGQRIFICQMRGTGVGAYEDNQIASYEEGTITLVHPLENDYTDSGASQAQVVVVPRASSVTGTFSVPAWDGDVGGLFVIACSGVFNGTINANGKGFRGGRSGANPDVDNQDGEQGEGTTGSQSRSSSASGNGGGGGTERATNEQGNGGGGGGHATEGTNGSFAVVSGGSVGQGGTTVGSSDLSTGIFMGGGGGGGGFGDSASSSSNNGNGGPGGGIVVVYAGSIASTASISSDGNVGQNGGNDQGGGGGGAGGTIYIKTRKVASINATAVGSDGGGVVGGGGKGGDGRIRIEACSFSGSTTPSASTQIGGHNYCGGSALLI